MANLAAGIGVLAGGALLITKAVTGASWRQIIDGQAIAAYKAKQGATGVVTAAGDSVPVPSSGGGQLSAAQETFAQRLASDTGLNLAVVKGWVHAEQPPTGPAPNGPNNWLNVGSTGSGFFSGQNPVWADPISAADATASWLAGTPIGNGVASSTGYGPPSAGIRSILSTAGSPVGVQVAAIQNSGWATSGYPELPAIVGEFR